MNQTHGVGRRKFLRGAAAGSALGAAEPIWSWGSGRQGPPSAAERDRRHWAAIPTREHYGDQEEQLEIPPSWDLTTFRMAGHDAPVLSADDMRRRVEAPVGSKRLADIARGKRTAVVTFDDLTRATPTIEVLPHVIGELRAGGIKDDNILLLASFGSHRPLGQPEAERKLGERLAGDYAWMNHNPFENLVDVGRTSRGNRIMINRHFEQADVRVTISGVKAHPKAGFGGGAKAVLPGIAWIESIHYFHVTIAGVGGNANPTVGYLKVFKNDVRLDMEEAARLARVDFGVQVLFNGARKVIGLFAGDIVEAHHAACRAALPLIRTEKARQADVVIANGYPQSIQALGCMHWIRSGLRDGGTAVLVAQHPQGMETIHYAGERWQYDARPFFETGHPTTWDVKQAAQLIVYSSYLQRRDRLLLPPRTIFTRTWGETLAAIGKVQRGDVKAALYPYGNLQYPPGDLDG